MTQQTKTYLLWALGIVIVGGLIWWGQQKDGLVSEQEETIKIGFIGPLSGDVAVFGEVMKQSTDIAVEEINSAGGIKGRMLQVLYEDGGCSGKGGVSAAQKLISVEKVKILFVTCSSETIAVAPIAEQAGVLQIGAWINHPDITKLKVFRLSYSDAGTAKLTADHIRAVGQKVGVLYELTDYSIGIKEAFAPYFESLGGTVIAEGVETNSSDVKSQLTKILAQEPDAIWLDPNSPNLGMIMLKQLRELGYTGPLYGNYFGSSEDIQKLPEAEGMIFFAEPIVSESEGKTRLFEKIKDKYGEYPTFEFAAVSQYDAMNILREALEEVGEDPVKIADYFYATEFEGLLGRFHFDANEDAVGLVPSVNQVKDGRAIPYEPAD